MKINAVCIDKLWGDIARVGATCKRCGNVDAHFTDYDELISPERFDEVYYGATGWTSNHPDPATT